MADRSEIEGVGGDGDGKGPVMLDALAWLGFIWLLTSLVTYMPVRVFGKRRPAAQKAALIGLGVALPIQFALGLGYGYIVTRPLLHPLSDAYFSLPGWLTYGVMMWISLGVPPTAAIVGWMIGTWCSDRCGERGARGM
ncbi:MAG: hypothetical protein AAF297_06485 [Planctomycetota bacterium]